MLKICLFDNIMTYSSKSKTVLISSVLFRTTQTLGLLHVVGRQVGEFIYLLRKNRKYTKRINKIQQLYYSFLCNI